MDLNTSLLNQYSSLYDNTTSTALNSALNTDSSKATDEETLEACKQFEQYFVEQMIKEMKKTLPEDSILGDNEYMNIFEDKFIEGIAENITDSGQLGLAQQLYDAMSAQNGTNIKSVEQ